LLIQEKQDGSGVLLYRISVVRVNWALSKTQGFVESEKSFVLAIEAVKQFFLCDHKRRGNV
jgi:hypothetical protein